jgi:methylglutaconyl-CoA hydratase
MADTVAVEREGSVATVALNRPDSHNAFNPQMVAELTSAFRELGSDAAVRLIVLTGRGRSFCAGADLATMRATADFDYDENVADGQRIFDLMLTVDSCPKPVFGRINGAAVGGGVGLVSCCDIVVAVERARFGFSEARLGIVPAVISPFVLAKIGVSQGRQLFLTGERFNAHAAREIGLVHHVVPEEELDEKVAERVDELLQAAPGAQAAAKKLIRQVAYRPPEELRAYTAELLALRRASSEGREGMTAFLEKRLPGWQKG